MDYALCELPRLAGAVTADADGQHHPEDILNVAQALGGEELVLGGLFEGAVPLRSRMGNSVTRVAFRYLVGQKLLERRPGSVASRAGSLPSG